MTETFLACPLCPLPHRVMCLLLVTEQCLREWRCGRCLNRGVGRCSAWEVRDKGHPCLFLIDFSVKLRGIAVL